MKQRSPLLQLLLAITSFVFLAAPVHAHDQGDIGSSAALLRHIFSAPDHVLMLVVGLALAAWVIRQKLSPRRITKMPQSKRRSQS